jgi:hypothetical protein
MNNKKEVDDMDVIELSRWLALFEGVNIIADKAEDSGKTFNYMQIKQPALEEYVDSSSILIHRALTRGARLNDG